MPFITEEIWQYIDERKEGESIMIAEMPQPVAYDADLINSFELLKEVVTTVRKVRNEKNLPNKEQLELFIKSDGDDYNHEFDSILAKLGFLSEIKMTEAKVEDAVSFLVKTAEYYIPMSGLIDVEEELKKMEEELKYQQGFLNSVMKKLSNERFVSGAPEKVVQMEKNKQADAESKIATLQERIAGLKK